MLNGGGGGMPGFMGMGGGGLLSQMFGGGGRRRARKGKILYCSHYDFKLFRRSNRSTIACCIGRFIQREDFKIATHQKGIVQILQWVYNNHFILIYLNFSLKDLEEKLML